MNCLIIGFGSIGQRHARILRGLGHQISVVSSQRVDQFPSFSNIHDAIYSADFEYVIISNKTNEHYQTLKSLLSTGFKNSILIEKPVFDRQYKIFDQSTPDIFIGYNLRFHPILQDIRNLIMDKEIYSMHVYCGQYLPEWRPGRDYSQCYSALKKSGGGVLRDLSHELDYITWLTGEWKQVTAIGGKISDLVIDSDDVYCVLAETKRCPAVSLQINYLDLKAKRVIIINADGLSLQADLIGNTLTYGNEIKHYDLTRDTTYIEQHKNIINGCRDVACTFEQGMDVLHLIECIEEASMKKIWKTKKQS
jgi:predicted dehydrogenase